MHEHRGDYEQIAQLMTGWLYRDVGDWENLAKLFHSDATLEISWFVGPAQEFVEASARMGESGLRTKHMIANPMVRYSEDGTRAVTETNAMIIGESEDHDLGCTAHTRLFDRLEKRDGQWRISYRTCIYDFAHFNYPVGAVDVDRDVLAQYPRAYAALAYILHLRGYPLTREYPTQGTTMERDVKEAAFAWLDQEKIS
ncbi:nuclear transport factor 2 family protein [Rothia koreensis]|jgi:hypothetical protein|uniref:nuclear transport factor 2 family protein n=1 Tax=Rothia koreensis TaxID=592378 RepID=UPI003F261205